MFHVMADIFRRGKGGGGGEGGCLCGRDRNCVRVAFRAYCVCKEENISIYLPYLSLGVMHDVLARFVLFVVGCLLVAKTGNNWRYFNRSARSPLPGVLYPASFIVQRNEENERSSQLPEHACNAQPARINAICIPLSSGPPVTKQISNAIPNPSLLHPLSPRPVVLQKTKKNTAGPGFYD